MSFASAELFEGEAGRLVPISHISISLEDLVFDLHEVPFRATARRWLLPSRQRNASTVNLQPGKSSLLRFFTPQALSVHKQFNFFGIGIYFHHQLAGQTPPT